MFINYAFAFKHVSLFRCPCYSPLLTWTNTNWFNVSVLSLCNSNFLYFLSDHFGTLWASFLFQSSNGWYPSYLVQVILLRFLFKFQTQLITTLFFTMQLLFFFKSKCHCGRFFNVINNGRINNWRSAATVCIFTHVERVHCPLGTACSDGTVQHHWRSVRVAMTTGIGTSPCRLIVKTGF